jgi:transcriptional regulator with XRE-family HTH domain
MDQKMRDCFSKNVKEIMLMRNMSQREFSEKLNITEVTLSRYLTGNRSPRMETIIRMAQVLDTTTDDLLRDTSNEDNDRVDYRRLLTIEREYQYILKFIQKSNVNWDDEKRMGIIKVLFEK